MTVIEVGSWRIVATIPVGDAPFRAAITPDGRFVYVANSGSDTVSVIDVASLSVVAQATVGDRPLIPAAAPDGRSVYVSNAGEGTVSVIDTAEPRLRGTIAVGGRPIGVAVSPSGLRLYVSTTRPTTSSSSIPPLIRSWGEPLSGPDPLDWPSRSSAPAGEMKLVGLPRRARSAPNGIAGAISVLEGADTNAPHPVAVFEAKVATSNMLNGSATVPDYSGVPTAVFTVSELARVGLLETDGRAAGLDVDVRYTDTRRWFSNYRIGETTGAVKIIIDRATDTIVGAHMFGAEYGDLINFCGLAIKLGLTTRQLKSITAAYPTVGSDLGSML